MSLRLLTLSTLTFLLTGCGNWVGDTEHVGRLAVGVDDAGQPVVLVAPCREGTTRIDISLGRTEDMDPSEQNEEVGEWTATEASADPSELNLADPGDAWQGESATAPTGDTMWIVDGTFADEKETVMPGPAFTGEQMSRLGADQVLVDQEGGSKAIARSAFDGGC